MRPPLTPLLFLFLQGLVCYSLFRSLPYLATFCASSILFFISLTLSIVTHLVATLKNPGYLQFQDSKAQPTNIQALSQLILQNRVHFCKICQIYQEVRTKHCYSCRMCVETFDHHCPFLQNCVGKYNRPHFFSYLFCQTMQLLLIEVLIGKELHQRMNYVLMVVGGFAGMMLVVMVGLLGMHGMLMLKGMTTWEYLAHEDIWYLKGRKNWRIFSDGMANNLRNYWFTSSKNVVVVEDHQQEVPS